MDEVTSTGRPKAPDLRVQQPPGLPPIQADIDKVSQVLINFLSNAVRHSPNDNWIEVSARLVDKTVEFRTRHQGPSVPPLHRDRIFDRHFGTPGSNGELSGTGLGLAISSEFVATVGGRTEVTEGAVFYFRLPIG